MTAHDTYSLVRFITILTALTPIFGKWMARIYTGEVKWLAVVEKRVLRLCGAGAGEMTWREYAWALMIFHLLGFLLLLGILLLQNFLPFNPQILPRLQLPVAVN